MSELSISQQLTEPVDRLSDGLYGVVLDAYREGRLAGVAHIRSELRAYLDALHEDNETQRAHGLG